MTYVDGYLTPVRPEMRGEFTALSARMAAVVFDGRRLVAGGFDVIADV